MPTRIKPDYKPTERVYQLLLTRFPELRTIERAREFVGHELDEFIMYWEGREDSGAAKANWHSTCLNWMKRVYENKREKQHGSHQPSNGDFFQQGLNNLPNRQLECMGQNTQPQLNAEPRTTQYRLPDPPKPGKAMTPEEAFNQLRKEGHI